MTVNAKISATDYNTIRDLAVKVMSSSSAGTNASYGYGQSIKSAAVSEGQTVKNTEWDLLRYDVINIINHLTGSYSVPQISASNVIKSDDNATSFNGYSTGSVVVVTDLLSGMMSPNFGITYGASGANITGQAPFPSVAITSAGSPTAVAGGAYTITYYFSTLSYTPKANINYIVSGNANGSLNGTFLCVASTSSSITLKYLSYPGGYAGGNPSFVPVTFPHGPSAWYCALPAVSFGTFSASDPAGLQPWQRYYNLMSAYAATSQRFALASSQRVTNLKASTTYTSDWNQFLSCEARVTFGSAQEARHFFNSGSLVRIRSTRTLGSGTTQDNDWSSLLNSAGNVDFGAQSPTTDFFPMNGQNFYRLTSTYQTAYSITSSGSYSTNVYKIEAKSDVADNGTGTATYIDFRISWTDSHYATGAGPDNVTGTLQVDVSEIKPSGTLLPSGSFAITSPTYTIGPISNNQTYAITAGATTVNEGSSVTFTISTTNVPNGTVMAWDTTQLGGITALDFTDGITSGLVTINNNTATITRTIATADLPINGSNPGFNAYTAQSTEGTEYFRINIKQGSTVSTEAASSAYVGISDTYTVSQPTFIQFPNQYVNVNTDSSAFVNIYYRRSVNHYVITRDELRRFGWYSGVTINAIGWTLVQHPYKPGANNIVQPVIPLPAFQIGMCNTTLAPGSNLGGLMTAVSPQADYTMPQIATWGGNQFIYWPLTTKFTWDGTSNLGVAFARGQVQDNYYTTGLMQMHNIYGKTGTSSARSVTDSAGTYGINDTATTSISGNRPAFVFYRD